jgi:hypothetical protein
MADLNRKLKTLRNKIAEALLMGNKHLAEYYRQRREKLSAYINKSSSKRKKRDRALDRFDISGETTTIEHPKETPQSPIEKQEPEPPAEEKRFEFTGKTTTTDQPTETEPVPESEPDRPAREPDARRFDSVPQSDNPPTPTRVSRQTRSVPTSQDEPADEPTDESKPIRRTSSNEDKPEFPTSGRSGDSELTLDKIKTLLDEQRRQIVQELTELITANLGYGP